MKKCSSSSENNRPQTPLLIWVLSALLFCYGFLLGGQQLILTQVSAHFGLGVLGMGTMVSVLHISSTIAPALMGILADRIGKKPILVIFSVLFGIGCLCAAFAPWLWMFLGSLLIIGAGYSVCESLTSAVCVDVSGAHGARYINLTQCLLSTGAILGPIALSALPVLSFELWRLLYILVGIPLILLGIGLSRMSFPAADMPRPENAPVPRNSILRFPVFWLFMAAMLIYVGLENGFGYFIEPLYATKESGSTLSAYGISAYWAGMALARLVYSFAAYPPRRAVRLSFLAAAVLFVSLILVPSGGLCVALCALVGFSYGPIWSTIVAGAAARFPQYKASATGFISASCGLGGILYPLLMGAIVEMLDIQAGFLILAGSAAVGAALSFILNKKP